jgi:hypothetical protein
MTAITRLDREFGKASASFRMFIVAELGLVSIVSCGGAARFDGRRRERPAYHWLPTTHPEA